jgi:amidase
MTPNNSIRDTPGPMARTMTDMTVLLDVIVGPDPQDPATARADGHRPPTYSTALRTDALKGARLGVLRQAFRPNQTDPRIIEQFAATLGELRNAGAEIVDPLDVPLLDTVPTPPQTPARFKDDLNKWIAKRPSVPLPSVAEIAQSRLVHPLIQPQFNEAAAAKPVEEDSATIEGLKNEQRYRDAFTAAMDAARVDAVILPTFRHLPVINGDRRQSTSLTMIASALQWPAISVPRGFLGEGLPQGLQIIGRAWEDSKIIGYAFAYEQSTHHRRPPTLPPMNL